ncbi:NADH-quinone oxidoreductase subunit C [uncultured Friedmanniella sp.]|uniref:NADH-quinone oxidoreductase subunit C n=1 Tax=uncultured Friedmanniella sp. TaxID=335381 RepID=UPI0035C9886B
MTPEVVAPAAWRHRVSAAREEGYDFFEWLAAVDEIGRDDVFRVVLVLRRLDEPDQTCVLSTDLPRDAPRLETLRDLYAGAAWHEREAAEMFGIEFVGGDPRRLLLAELEGTPMRKDEVLAARSSGPWPGAKEPGESEASPSRRRMVPPGVPDPAVWGDREGGSPATPVEVAESAVGGRVRRRRP